MIPRRKVLYKSCAIAVTVLVPLSPFFQRVCNNTVYGLCVGVCGVCVCKTLKGGNLKELV